MPYIPKDLQADTKLVYTTRKYITQAVSVPSKEWKIEFIQQNWEIQFSQPIWRIEWKEGS
jgi:hypothetical protein